MHRGAKVRVWVDGAVGSNYAQHRHAPLRFLWIKPSLEAKSSAVCLPGAHTYMHGQRSKTLARCRVVGPTCPHPSSLLSSAALSLRPTRMHFKNKCASSSAKFIIVVRTSTRRRAPSQHLDCRQARPKWARHSWVAPVTPPLSSFTDTTGSRAALLSPQQFTA